MIPTKNEYWSNEAEKKTGQKQVHIQYATVTALTHQGDPIIQFHGDKTPSKKIYKHLKSYTPTTGDRVILINNFIMGAWTV